MPHCPHNLVELLRAPVRAFGRTHTFCQRTSNAETLRKGKVNEHSVVEHLPCEVTYQNSSFHLSDLKRCVCMDYNDPVAFVIGTMEV